MAGEQYTDPLYCAMPETTIPNISGTATATASAAAATAADASKFEVFARCKLLAMKAQVLTASPIPTAQALLMNGTTQLGDTTSGCLHSICEPAAQVSPSAAGFSE